MTDEISLADIWKKLLHICDLDKERAVCLIALEKEVAAIKVEQLNDKEMIKELRKAKHAHAGDLHKISGQIHSIFNDFNYLKEKIDNIEKFHSETKDDISFIKETLAGDAGKNN